MSGVKISGVAVGSPAAGVGVRVGDVLVSVNGVQPTDIIEYQRLIDGERVELLLRADDSPLGRKVVIAKQAGESLGITVDSAVFDRIRTCDNHCSFCFIYQLPKGMRRSLYVKDDDYRLSFLYGNYTTLTRFTEFDLERVIDERLSPLYVSIHTTNPEKRAEMLRNPRGATSLRWLRALLDAGIEVHGQIVLCPGVNDGRYLEETLQDAVTDYAGLATMSVVPLGVSVFSTEESMRPSTALEAREVVSLVERYQGIARATLGRTLIYASDEFYLLAGANPPAADYFESLDQAENGVGLTAAFRQSFANASAMPALGTGFFQSVDGAPAWGYKAPRASEFGSAVHASRVAVLTGTYAAPVLRRLFDEHGYDWVDVQPVVNEYFGGNIAVAGLLTGHDLERTLQSASPDTLYLLPDLCLSDDLFLDGRKLGELAANIRVVPTTGVDLRTTLDSLKPKDAV